MYEAMIRDLLLARGGYGNQRMQSGGQGCGVPGSIKHRGKKKGRGKLKKKKSR